ncbi:hypothetical protein [Idiomarina seosinensis]|nr:hypothetical protein [Idiomarina seosinensis]
MAVENQKDPSGFPFLLVGLVLFIAISCLPLVLRFVQLFTA